MSREFSEEDIITLLSDPTPANRQQQIRSRTKPQRDVEPPDSESSLYETDVRPVLDRIVEVAEHERADSEPAVLRARQWSTTAATLGAVMGLLVSVLMLFAVMARGVDTQVRFWSINTIGFIVAPFLVITPLFYGSGYALGLVTGLVRGGPDENKHTKARLSASIGTDNPAAVRLLIILVFCLAAVLSLVFGLMWMTQR